MRLPASHRLRPRPASSHLVAPGTPCGVCEQADAVQLDGASNTPVCASCVDRAQ